VHSLLHSSYHLVRHNGDWMGWNLFLALIPAVLSASLFAGRRRRGLLWWVGLAAFLAFLPNAPYVLTDVVHFARDVRLAPSDTVGALAGIPLYAAFVLVGFGAYVASLRNLDHYLTANGLRRYVLAAETAIHAACAVGIWLGRFPELNSWDIAARPRSVAGELHYAFTHPQPLAVMMTTFVIVAGFYELARRLTLAVATVTSGR
jgi:uncharacterized membrane protein